MTNTTPKEVLLFLGAIEEKALFLRVQERWTVDSMGFFLQILTDCQVCNSGNNPFIDPKPFKALQVSSNFLD